MQISMSRIKSNLTSLFWALVYPGIITQAFQCYPSSPFVTEKDDFYDNATLHLIRKSKKTFPRSTSWIPIDDCLHVAMSIKDHSFLPPPPPLRKQEGHVPPFNPSEGVHDIIQKSRPPFPAK